MLSYLFKHSAWLLLARLLSLAVLALSTVLAARQLEGNGYGEYAFMATLILIGNLLTTFGTDMFLIREIARDGRLDRLPAALAWQIFLSTLFVVGMYLATPLFPFLSTAGRLAMHIYSLTLFPLAFFTVFTTALRGKQQMGAYTVLNVFLAAGQLSAVGTLYFGGGNLVMLAWLLLLVQLAAALFAGLLCLLKIPGFQEGWSLSRQSVLSLVGASAPVAVVSVINAVYQRLGLALLPFLVGALQTGLFAAALRMVEMAKVGHMAAFTVLYPMMAERNERGLAWLKPFRLPWLSLLGAAGAASLALYWMAGPLVTGLFGKEYSQAIPLVKILAWIILPYTINMFLCLAFLAQGDATVITTALTAGLIGLGIMIAWWGQTSGTHGAAWAVVAAEVLQSLILAVFAAQRYAWLPFKLGGPHEIPDLS